MTRVFRLGVLLGMIMIAVFCNRSALGEDASPKTAMPLVFEDAFDAGMDRWVMTDASAWKVAEDEGGPVLSLFGKSNYAPPFRSPLCIARVKDLEVGECIIEAKMKQTGKEYGHRDMCIFFGYQDPSHFYYVHIATQSDPHANSVFIVNNAARVSIAEERNSGTDWSTGYHKVRVERKTDTGEIRVFFDDMEKPIMKATDKTFLSGGIGFGSFDDTGNIDDVKIFGVKKDK